MIAEESELLKVVRYMSAGFRLKYLRKCVNDRIYSKSLSFGSMLSLVTTTDAIEVHLLG